MDFPIEVNVHLKQSNIQNILPSVIKVHSGMTTILGPNSAGKTQLLKSLKQEISLYAEEKKIRHISINNLGPLEKFQSSFSIKKGTPPSQEQQKPQTSFPSDLAIYPAKRHQDDDAIPNALNIGIESVAELSSNKINIDLSEYQFSREEIAPEDSASAHKKRNLFRLVSILEALYDDDVRVLFIDDPETSLHPELQSFVYQEASKVAGSPDQPGKKLVFLSTPSTDFLQLHTFDDLASIILYSDTQQAPMQIDSAIEVFKKRTVNALITKIEQENKLVIFGDRPLLVEDPSAQHICTGLSRIFDLDTEAAGSQILPISGNGQMPSIIKLMRLLGKTPCVLVNADALTDNIDLINSFVNQRDADSIAIELGHRSASQFSRDIYLDFAQFVADNWDDIKVIAMKHDYWLNRDPKRDISIAKRRAAFCSLLETEAETILHLENHATWNTLKIRLLSLIKLLRQLGCFVLKKGTVEAYYFNADKHQHEQQLNAAASEVSYMAEMNPYQLEDNFMDILDSLKYAAQANKLNNGTAIRDMVLTIVSPVLDSINVTTPEFELEMLCQNLFGKNANLFNLSIECSEKIVLVVSLSSGSMLDVTGFPLKLDLESSPAAINININNQMEFA